MLELFKSSYPILFISMPWICTYSIVENSLDQDKQECAKLSCRKKIVWFDLNIKIHFEEIVSFRYSTSNSGNKIKRIFFVPACHVIWSISPKVIAIKNNQVITSLLV